MKSTSVYKINIDTNIGLHLSAEFLALVWSDAVDKYPMLALSTSTKWIYPKNLYFVIFTVFIPIFFILKVFMNKFSLFHWRFLIFEYCV